MSPELLQELLLRSDVFVAKVGYVIHKTKDRYLRINSHWITKNINWYNTIRIDLNQKEHHIEVVFNFPKIRDDRSSQSRYRLDELTIQDLFDECSKTLKDTAKFNLWKTQILREVQLEKLLN